MKQVRIIFAMIIGLFCLCGCRSNMGNIEKGQEADFVYPMEGLSVFCLDEDGLLYTYLQETGSICAYNPKGELVRSVETEQRKFHELCYGDGRLYAFVSEDSENILYEKICLVEISLEDGSQTMIYENQKAWAVQGLTYSSRRLYFIEKDSTDSAEAELMSDPTGEYYYAGERLLCYSMETQAVEEIPIERVKAFAPKDSSAIWVYGYDMDYGEYYFAEYAPETGILQAESYVGDVFGGFNVFLDGFAYDAVCDRLLLADVFKAAVVAMDPKNINSCSSFYEIGEGLIGSGRLQCLDGRSYFLLNGKIHRIKNSNYLKAYEPLKIYFSSHGYSIPEGTGFEIDMMEVDEETMAMSMMAQDRDYDFLLLSTESSVAEQIRRVGAYEPLNRVSGVEEYLEDSFDFIRAAATDENGAVWMLPCDVSCQLLLYNSKLCSVYGIDFENAYSNETLYQAQLLLEQAEERGNPSYYQYNFSKDWYRLMDMYLADYAVGNGGACFDTKVFRQYSKMFQTEQDRDMERVYRYARLNPGSNAPGMGATEDEVADYYRSYFSQVAFVAADKGQLSTEYSNAIGGSSYGLLDYDFFDVKALPSLEQEKPAKNMAYAYILVLNPNSNHLQEAKEFLSVLTERMRNEESIFRTRELSGEYDELEKSVHALYENSRIVFSYPSDVFWDEYAKYLNHEKSLDELIPELERKMNLYLQE